MGISYNPSIVTEGLVLGLDPQSTRSYVGSGTTWTDLTNRGNNGTLTNGPVFIPGGPFNNSGGSVYFDGTDDELNFTSIDVGTGDFTYEAWIYPTVATIDTPIIVWHNSTSKIHTFGIWNGSAIDAIFSANARPGSANSWVVASAISLNTWHHIAFVRASGILKLYVDGTEESLSAGSGSPGGDYSSYSTDVSYVGSSAINENFVGYISNARVINGTALYTANFTPPTGPLEAIEGTVLLTCQGGAITDNGPNSHAITVNNDAKAVTASAFEFDGTSDYVVTSSNTDFLFGTEEFAMEWWEYFTGSTDYQGHIGVFKYGAGDDTAHIWTQGGSFQGFPGGWTSIAMQPISNQWAHYVVTGTSGDIKFYQNGELKDTKTWDWSATSSTSNFAVAGTPGWTFGNYEMSGKISAVRVYKGKSFTEDEVKQNFSALRGRYGI